MVGKRYNILIFLLIFGGFWLLLSNPISAQSPPVSIIWQNLVDIIPSGNTITKTTPNGWGAGASGASSTQYIPTGYEGYVEFSMTNNAGMAGLSNGDPDADYPSLDYAIQAGPNYGSSVVVYENGVQKATSPISYNSSDRYRVALESGVVKYYHNGTLIYTSFTLPAYPLLFDTALYANGGQIQNAVIATDPVAVLPPPPGPQATGCTLISAFFNYCSSNPPILGSPVHLVVTAQGCPPGYDVSFIIKEEDTGLGDDQRPGQLTAKFDSTGTSAQILWTVDGDVWDDDSVGGGGILVSPNYQFYFEASAVDPQTRINSYNSSGKYLQVPLNSKGGCINCAPILAPGICQCNDGSSFDRSYWGGIQGGNCRDIICQDHKGDALVDKCGSGLGPGQPGTDVPFKWGIFNPLKGMSKTQNVFDLVVIIADWILNIAGSLIIILIIYSGVRFLISRGNPGEIQKAKGILFWALVGFGVILIGKGFIYLIESVLQGKMPIF